MKKIIIIPPNGQLKKQDFAIQRMGSYLIDKLNYKITLIYIRNDILIKNNMHEKIVYIEKENTAQILEHLTIHNNYDFILSRAWMHSYPFSAKIAKKFNNVIVYIKDWNFSNKKEYKFLFGNDYDFKAIKTIFRKSLFILSHYSNEQAKIWSKKYKVNKNKILFLPEFPNSENFSSKKCNIQKNIKLVFAGTFPSSSKPEQFFLTKGLLRATKVLNTQKIEINILTPPKNYEEIQQNKNLYQDILFENQFNNLFNLKKGEILNPSFLSEYDYGFFIIEYTTKKELLNKFAVPSKFSLYLEAGIPLIINKKHKTLAKYVKKYKLGVVFENKDIKNLHKILNNISLNEYKSFIKNIIKFREYFSYENSTLKSIL